MVYRGVLSKPEVTGTGNSSFCSNVSDHFLEWETHIRVSLNITDSVMKGSNDYSYSKNPFASVSPLAVES